ncbi:cytochrome P450 [Teratosphaeria nubilosa]|uniref:Cytochrome P450 n=1 Tax=Teratosphaeria nubilosa TaxID=161662 RepID=A0A6G1LL95_9PEZI|nr:cytochrome P450 [Teratosphaeria nubilosa]
MAHLSSVSLVACGSVVVLYFARKALDSIRYFQKTKSRQCGPLKSFPHWDPIWGIDWVLSMSRAFTEHRWLAWMEETWTAMGTSTFKARFLGMRMVYTSEMENMKAMSTSQWQEFVIEPIRVDNGAAAPFTGKGVSTSDGEFWQRSHNIVKPYFDRQGFSNVERLKPFTDALLDLIPANGKAFDFQTLIRRWFLDTSTEFVFGKTRDSLHHPEREDVLLAMVDIMRGARVRLTMGTFMFLHRDPSWYAAIRVVHDFMDVYIDDALEERRRRAENPEKFAATPERTDLLWDITGHVGDNKLIRDQITAVWVPSNETTSINISNAIYMLARHPAVWKRLQSEIQALGDQKLTFSLLRGLPYLNWVINETHRLMPNGIQMIRSAAHDTTLPRGGGPDGKQCIFIAKGDVVHGNRYLLHRDPEFWGSDAADFRPERWETVRPLWHFVPFGGGPRICPAHVLALTEAAYVLTRFCQRFKTLEARDPNPYVPLMRIGQSSLHGVKVAVTPW